MNKKVKIITAVAAVAMSVTLTGCGGFMGCAGCNTKTASNTLTRSNWFTGTSYNGIQPSFIEGDGNFSPEIITYGVTFDGTNASNANLSLEYKDGTFTTEFYATQYDWTGADIPAGYADKSVSSETVYIYKTQLTISVKYTMKIGDKAESEWFNDSVETVSYFRATGKTLQPVYSKQVIKSTSPANYQPKTLADAYQIVDVTYENFYNYACTEVLCKTTENGEMSAKRYDKLSSTVFDNSSLYIVARSMKLSSSLSQTVTLFSAAAGGSDEYAIVGTDVPLPTQERAYFTEQLTGAGLYNAVENDAGVQTTAVNISYAGGDLHGTSQTVWFASILQPDNNVSRATMLKLSVPISFSLGTLNFTLQEINSTLWNE